MFNLHQVFTILHIIFQDCFNTKNQVYNKKIKDTLSSSTMIHTILILSSNRNETNPLQSISSGRHPLSGQPPDSLQPPRLSYLIQVNVRGLLSPIVEEEVACRSVERRIPFCTRLAHCPWHVCVLLYILVHLRRPRKFLFHPMDVHRLSSILPFHRS